MEAYAQGAIRPVIQQLTEEALPAINTSVIKGGPGGMGSSRQGIAQALATERTARAANDITAQIYSDAYGKNLEAYTRGLALAPQTMTAGLIPAETIAGVGAQQRDYNQAVMDDAARRYEYDQQLPWNNLAAYQNIIQGTYGGTGSVQGSSPSTLNQVLGAGLTGLGTYGTIMGTPALAAGMGPAAPWVAGGLALASLFA